MFDRQTTEERRLDAAAATLEDSPLIPACDDAVQSSKLRRGARFIELLAEIGMPIEGRTLVDLGSGYGSLAMAAAAAGAAVTAVDVNPERLRLLEERASSRGLAIKIEEANLLDMPANVADAEVAFLVGVIEYAGLWREGERVIDTQVLALRAAHALLRPEGRLVFASKNRLWPRFVAADIHTGQPLVNALPRSLADWLSRRLWGRPYLHHIHSPRRWEHLLALAGFRSMRVYFPYMSYQFPVLLSERLNWRAISGIAKLRRQSPEISVAVGRLWLPKALLMALCGSLGLPVSQSVLIVAEK